MIDLSEFVHPSSKAEGAVQNLNETASAELASGVGERPLFNRGSPAPQYLRQREREWHRHVALLAARGFSCREIGEMLGYNPTSVQETLKQPFIQEVMLEETRRVASEDERVITIVKENVAKAVEVLATICKDQDAPKRDRIAAANAILDRRYGKPNQPIARETGIDLDKLTDADLVKMLPSTVSTGTTE